jgi:hypothetical protein
MKAGCLKENIYQKRKYAKQAKKTKANSAPKRASNADFAYTNAELTTLEKIKLHLKSRYSTYYRKENMLISVVEVPLRNGTDITIFERLYFQKLKDNGFEMIEAAKYSWPKHWNEKNSRLIFNIEESFDEIYWYNVS